MSLTSVGSAAAQSPPPWQELLQRIVEINSGSNNPDGLDEVRGVLIPAFEELGLEATTHDFDDGHKMVSLVAPDATPELLLMGHLDTVFPPDSDFRTFELVGDRIVGPGVIDMKAGVVLIHEIVRALSDTDQLRKIMVILNDDEEIGSTYSQDRYRELTADIAAGLIFEPGLPGGAVVTSHSGVIWMDLTVDGRAAHAGLEPEKGINACVELADKVVRLSGLSDYDRRLSVNTGVIEGGTRPNVVCETATARIDMRFVEPADRVATLAAIETITAEMAVTNELLGAAPTATLETVVDIDSMPESSTDRLFGLLQTAGDRVGQDVIGSHAGFTSDANHLVQTGMDLLVGLGPYGEGMHTDTEFLTISTFDERLELTLALIDEILR